MFALTASLVASILSVPVQAQSNLGGQGYVDLAVSGDVPDRKGAGILYGLPNNPAYSPQAAPSRSIWGGFYADAGISWLRAGGAQIPFPGYAADVSNRNTSGYDARFASTLSNYRDMRALDTNSRFVLLPHDIWGADSFESTTNIYPCDNGDCSEWGRFLDKLIASLKSNNMLTNLYIDIWNEPDGNGFWPRSQAQYLQAWDFAYDKYRAALSSAILVGPSTASQPGLDNGWWTTYADHIKKTNKIPDWYSAHQLNGRNSPNCGNDPVNTQNQLNQVLSRYGLPSRPFQLNEYAAPDEQTPAYTAWFIERFERTGITGLRANWGSRVGLHNDMAKILGPGGSDKSSNFYKLGDWHVLNYYTKMQKGLITLAGATVSTCYDLYVTQERNIGVVHILAGTRGQTGSYPITISNVNAVPAYNGRSTLRALIREIPYNNGGRVDSPIVVSNRTLAVSNNKAVITLNQNLDSAYTIDVFAQ
ncbi:putative glycoside hydrolase superfamily, glycoside hydrolase, family 5 [Septoria linicola]|nr:putative glycoside hydrolase superfamily, glycoside hydrolase, family 5 [Septoria linicola]